MRINRLALGLLIFLGFGSIALAAATSCEDEVGKKQAAVLVERCLQISPATHPPCNAQNPCPLIEDEIKRGCKFARETKGAVVPDFCN